MTQQSRSVLMAMSGGVDSSVGAMLLQDQGYAVTGMTLHLLSCTRDEERSCCSTRDRMDARRICEELGCSHIVVDARTSFRDAVIQPFIEAYLEGLTPSPCIRCNEAIKFPLLLAEAKRLNIPFIATGHYARVIEEGGIFRLLRGGDPKKDQSYFLFSLTQETLRHLLFPLEALTKRDVRAIAHARSLVTREKPESQEVCFVPDDDYAQFLDERAGERLPGPGPFVDLSGKQLGSHQGAHRYTIGQRRGIGFGLGRRQYVVAKDASENVVTLGDRDALLRSECVVSDTSWVHPSFAQRTVATVKIRSTHAGEEAELIPLPDGRVGIQFRRPVSALAPGQAAVFYRGEEVLGGGWMT